MMTEEQIAKYVGKAYAEGAQGPDAFNCWGLLMHIERTYFDMHLPILPIGDEARCFASFAEMVRGGYWEQVEQPRDGDGVLLRGGTAPHVGVYLRGGVLHSIDPFGVVWQKQITIKATFGRTKYYRFHERKSDRTYGPIPPAL